MDKHNESGKHKGLPPPSTSTINRQPSTVNHLRCQLATTENKRMTSRTLSFFRVIFFYSKYKFLYIKFYSSRQFQILLKKTTFCQQQHNRQNTVIILNKESFYYIKMAFIMFRISPQS